MESSRRKFLEIALRAPIAAMLTDDADGSTLVTADTAHDTASAPPRRFKFEAQQAFVRRRACARDTAPQLENGTLRRLGLCVHIHTVTVLGQ